MGTAWLTAYRMLFVKSGLRPGQKRPRAGRLRRGVDGADPLELVLRHGAPRYRLGGISFQNNRAVANVKVLRLQFRIRDGTIFSRKKIGQGLENLRLAYRQLGYVNFTAVPSPTFQDENGLVYLAVDVDEGKQFYVSNLKVDGVPPQESQKLLRNSLLHPGQVYNDRLLRYSMKALPLPDPSSISTYKLDLDEAEGTVAIAIRFVHCPGR